jgi:hypothetical protein
MELAQYEYDDEELAYLADIEKTDVLGEAFQEWAEQEAYRDQTLGQQRKDIKRSKYNEFNVHDEKILNSKHFSAFCLVA